MLVASFLSPKELGMLSLINSEWHGLMTSDIADIVLWRPFCRKTLGKVLTKEECNSFDRKQSSCVVGLPHQDLYIRKFLLVQDMGAAANSLLCAKVSIALIAATTLMKKYGSMAAQEKYRDKCSDGLKEQPGSFAGVTSLLIAIRFYLATTDESVTVDFPNTTLLVHSAEKRKRLLFETSGSMTEEILTCATGALMNAALVGDRYRDEIIKMNGISCFTKILDERQSFTRLSKYASGALWNLTQNSRYCRHTMEKYMEKLVSSLKRFWVACKNDTITSYGLATAASCAGIIACCCSEVYHENQVELMELGCIEVLLLVVQKIYYRISSGQKLLINCCAALRNILMKQPRAQKIFLDSGGVACMMSIINPTGIWNCDYGRATLRTAAAVLVNATNEDNRARCEIDIHRLCNYIMDPNLKSSDAVLYTGILQNVTCTSPELSLEIYKIIVACCYLYTERSACKYKLITENSLHVPCDESCCLTRLMCALRNLSLNPVNLKQLYKAGIEEVSKRVKYSCSADARYHACKTLANIQHNYALDEKGKG